MKCWAASLDQPACSLEALPISALTSARVMQSSFRRGLLTDALKLTPLFALEPTQKDRPGIPAQASRTSGRTQMHALPHSGIGQAIRFVADKPNRALVILASN